MKYEVIGFIQVKMTVEADSEEEAIETAAESFDKEKHIEEDIEPQFETANEIGGLDDDEDEDSPLKRSNRAMFSDDEDED